MIILNINMYLQQKQRDIQESIEINQDGHYDILIINYDVLCVNSSY
jgi:hypothetical protein